MRALRALSAYADTLLRQPDKVDSLYVLTEMVAGALDIAAAGVSLGEESTLRFVTTFNERVQGIELTQEETQRGVCVEAYGSNTPVTVVDVQTEGQRWPEIVKVATEIGIHAVAGIPLSAGDITVGALNLYDDEVREWTEEDVMIASLMARMATLYLLSSSELEEHRNVNAQLQHALDGRVIIEQAKGFLSAEKGITLRDAFELMRRHARSNNMTVRDTAAAVLDKGLQL
jgi:GAF domain-containing protein